VLHGLTLPPDLHESSPLPEPLFTPATKAQAGHDENISFEQACALVGRETMTLLRDYTLRLYREAHEYARTRGIILADTKFEFGYDATGQVILIDEALTPDSSRFWDAAQYQPGKPQPSFDKQFVRDYLEAIGCIIRIVADLLHRVFRRVGQPTPNAARNRILTSRPQKGARYNRAKGIDSAAK
jgi:phosphoribosylaminoimidazole-succinocarboxamide synthase